jgi:hypothetical protein
LWEHHWWSNDQCTLLNKDPVLTAWANIWATYLLWRFKVHGLSYDPASRQGSLNGSVQRQRKQKQDRENSFNLSQNSEVLSLKVGRHCIPLDGRTTALWGSHCWDVVAYLLELLRTFLFPTHPPGYVSLLTWLEINKDSTLKKGLLRIVNGLRVSSWTSSRLASHFCKDILRMWGAKWRLNGPLVLHAANVWAFHAILSRKAWRWLWICLC